MLFKEENVITSILTSSNEKYCKIYQNESTKYLLDKLTFPKSDILFPNNKKLRVYHYGEKDILSHSMMLNGLWESGLIANTLKIMQKDPTLQLIDIGGNIGTYTLAVAACLDPPRQVVTVEPMKEACHRLHASLVYNKVEKQVTLVQNALSDVRHQVTILIVENLVGASLIVNDNDPRLETMPSTKLKSIFMNDLLEVIPFNRAIMKIDIEGSEFRAFSHADLLFDKIDIPIIIMEWTHSRWPYTGPTIVNFLKSRNYSAFSSILLSQADLNMNAFGVWPENIVWKKPPYLVP